MKNFVKFVCLALVLVMTLCAFASCSGTANTPADTDGADTDSSANNNAAGSTIKIGGIGPITGGAAIYGISVMNGMQIAVDEINAAGGICGAQIEYKFEDDVHDPETSVNAYNSLVDWGMNALIGTVTTGPALSVSPLAYEDRIFMLTPSASSTDVTDGKDNVFQLCFSDPNQGTGSAQYIGENMKDSKIAIIYRNDDAYSQGIRDTFVAEAANHSLNIVYEGTFTDATSTDFSVQLTGAKNAGADLVFLPIYYQPASVIFTQAAAMDYAPIFFGVDGMDGILTMEGFDTKLAEGVYVLTPFSADSTDEATVSFVTKYQDKYGEVPTQFAADGYDCVYALKAACEKAGYTADMNTEGLCDALMTAMTEITVDGVTGAGMTWSADGSVNKAPMAVIIKDGAYVSAK